ncbi:ankyrin repeat-containing protein At2g01680 [Setaria italica]|nr:ankyrin repeat-containing protein At2g01680 [Setaria italica]
MSPLYRAIFLAEGDAPQMISNARDDDQSNCGPNGQNVLHVAALRSKDLTQKVLKTWDDLRNGADGSRSTPLHYAASVGVKGITELLLKADTTGDMKAAADSHGMRPIHVAASVGAMDALLALVHGNEDDSSATLLVRDNRGRTFLHVAVENKKTEVVKFVCREPTFKDYVVRLVAGGERRPTFRNILNMKDDDGNTALHLAVKNRDENSFRHLVGNMHVELNRVNNDGYTPLDLASKIVNTENSFASRHQENPTEWMIRVLAHSGAYFSARRRDLKFGVTQNDQEPGLAPSMQTKEVDQALATESVLVASALIATLTFAAAFTVPGSYKTDGDPRAGTPALGGHYGFKVFIVADMLAFFCSVAATFSLAEYANRAGVDPLVRAVYAQRAVRLFHVALRSVIVAFALGVSVVMWDISVVTTVIVGVATSALVLYGNEALAHDIRLVRIMYRRFGFLCSGTLHPSTSSHLDWNTWRLRSFYATLVQNIVKLIWTYGFIFLVAYIAQLKQKDGI